MPHIFTNRPRLHQLTPDKRDLAGRFRWETVNAVLYKIGGIIFIIGSILFFPYFHNHADLGAWTFFAGSLVYLIVTGHDFLEVLHYWNHQDGNPRDRFLEIIAANAYFWGTVLFTVGSVLFVSAVGRYIAGAWCFVAGSGLFVLGACINVLQIIKYRSMITLQLMNLTAVSFVVGSVLFTVASIPYLWNIEDKAIHETLYTFLAGQYLVGSILFFVGGVFNYWRACVVMNEERN